MKKASFFYCILLFSVATSYAQGAITWNPAMQLASSASGNEHPRIALDGSGNPLVVWHHASRCMFSRWDGAAFSSPVMLNPVSITVAGASWMGPDIAAHGDTVYAVFKQTPEPCDSCRIYCVHSYDGGLTFSTPLTVDNIADDRSRFPTVSTDDVGNPLVGFMKFDPFFGEARWVVVRSTDFGNSFSLDVKASGWSDANSTVCDCCPGAIACLGNTVAMLYRDNNADVRDSWTGLSTDNGDSFLGGMGIDQQNWLINSCPSTGPDGVIIGDTLYATFANGASGKSLVYYSKTSISDLVGSKSTALTGTIPGLSQQNYPRIASDGKALAIAWTQVISGNSQCALRFTNNISNGLTDAYDIVDLNNITNCDVALHNGKINVMWEDDNSGTIRYRSGTYTPTSGIMENVAQQRVSIFPNPTNSVVTIAGDNVIDKVVVVNMFGEIVFQATPHAPSFSMTFEHSGIHFVVVTTNQQSTFSKLIVTK